ncbi:MAG: aspartate kinase [Polyangiales bacterium]
MAVIVQKYGGSSVADLARLGVVADRVAAAQRAGDRVVVVVSAMGKTTDQLLGLARQITPSPHRRELDMLLSVGERTSMALLAIALHARDIDAISFTGSQSGIITNDRHFDARIIEVRPFRIEDELARDRVVIVAGYQGMSYRREITTLGRGGSDTTAVALAAALNAERCEIYSDVDGVYSADPRVVPSARHLGELGYEELQEMAEAGAKVLNAEAVEFARRERITLFARRTVDAGDAGSRETVVRRDPPPANRGVRAVVGDLNVAWAYGAPRGGAWSLLEALDALEVPVREASAHGDSLSVVIPTLRVLDFSRARALLRERGMTVRDAEGDGAVGEVSLVGAGVSADRRALLDARDVARREGAEVLGASTAPLRVTLRVAREAVDSLTRALHDRFVGPC